MSIYLIEFTLEFMMIYVFMSPFSLRTLSSRENFFLVGSVLAILMSRTSLSYFYHLFSFPNGMIC